MAAHTWQADQNASHLQLLVRVLVATGCICLSGRSAVLGVVVGVNNSNTYSGWHLQLCRLLDTLLNCVWLVVAPSILNLLKQCFVLCI
jgi:hypothetical protein